MPLLRHLLPLLALLVGGVVAVQALDLVACADEVLCADGHQEAGHGGHGDESGPDCLCHLAFTSAGEQEAVERPELAQALRVERAADRYDAGARRRLERPPIG